MSGSGRGRWFRLVSGCAAVTLISATCALAVSMEGAVAASSKLCSGYAACDAAGYNSHNYQTYESTTFWDMDNGNECTNYTAFVESTVFGIPRPAYNLGNGGEWAANASAHGVLVNQTPTVGSVAEWNGGDAGMSSLGHVAVVEQVGPNDSYIVISQQHILDDANGYDWTMINAGGSPSQWEEWPDNFIHFNSAAAQAVSENRAATKSPFRRTPASRGR